MFRFLLYIYICVKCVYIEVYTEEDLKIDGKEIILYYIVYIVSVIFIY